MTLQFWRLKTVFFFWTTYGKAGKLDRTYSTDYYSGFRQSVY